MEQQIRSSASVLGKRQRLCEGIMEYMLQDERGRYTQDELEFLLGVPDNWSWRDSDSSWVTVKGDPFFKFKIYKIFWSYATAVFLISWNKPAFFAWDEWFSSWLRYLCKISPSFPFRPWWWHSQSKWFFFTPFYALMKINWLWSCLFESQVFPSSDHDIFGIFKTPKWPVLRRTCRITLADLVYSQLFVWL